MHGAIPPFLQYDFMAWCLVKHRDNFTFLYLYEIPAKITAVTDYCVVLIASY
jgi:hypothetical protein